ncbi:MAG: hypothetical protein ABL907_25165 [Hyphomicrobium sp.]
MDTQPRGNFTLNLNYRREANPKAPPITGRISAPEAPDVEYSFDAWKHDSDKGPYWIGPVSPVRSMRQAMTTGKPADGTHFIAIRMNSFKVFATLDDNSPNPDYEALDAEQRALEDRKPAFWASWTRDPAKDAEVRASAWDRETGRYGPWASGNTQYPQKSADRAAANLTLDMPSPSDFPDAAEANPAKTDTRKRSRDRDR